MNNIATASPDGRELTPAFLYELIKKNVGRIEALEIREAKTARAVTDIEEEYPLLPPEADDLSIAVRKKGVELMGGKKSPAYNNKELRTRIFRDIYYEIKRQYGLIDEKGVQASYKKLKRKYYSGAIAVVGAYVLPIGLQNEVEAENEAGELDD